MSEVHLGADVLRTLELLRRQASAIEEAGGAGGSSGHAPVAFDQVLGAVLDRVNGMQREAGALATAFERGAPEVDLTAVMVASQKAGIAFQAVAEVRNRLVRAYQDVMSMPI